MPRLGRAWVLMMPFLGRGSVSGFASLRAGEGTGKLGVGASCPVASTCMQRVGLSLIISWIWLVG